MWLMQTVKFDRAHCLRTHIRPLAWERPGRSPPGNYHVKLSFWFSALRRFEGVNVSSPSVMEPTVGGGRNREQPDIVHSSSAAAWRGKKKKWKNKTSQTWWELLLGGWRIVTCTVCEVVSVDHVRHSNRTEILLKVSK